MKVFAYQNVIFWLVWRRCCFVYVCVFCLLYLGLYQAQTAKECAFALNIFAESVSVSVICNKMYTWKPFSMQRSKPSIWLHNTLSICEMILGFWCSMCPMRPIDDLPLRWSLSVQRWNVLDDSAHHKCHSLHIMLECFTCHVATTIENLSSSS